MAYANLAALAMNHEDAGGNAEWGGRALELARTLGDEAIEIHALNSIGTMEFLARGPGARAKTERSLERALRCRAGSTMRCARTRTSSGRRCATAPIRSPTATSSEATEYASDPDVDLWRIYLLGFRTRAELDQGRWDEAAETAALVVRGRLASPLPVIIALTVTARLRARRGDPDPWSPLDEARALAGAELQRIEPVAVACAEAAWLAGDRDRVHRRDRPRRSRLRESAMPAGCSARSLCWRRRAGVEVDPGAEVAEPYALELAGEHEQAAARWAALGCPYEAALALAGADDEAAQRRALDELLALGATAAAAVVGRRLRERGAANLPRGPRPATRENPAQLTARELEVLDARRRRPAQPRHRRAPVPLAQDGRPPRLRDPAQARRAHARRGRGGGDPAWAPPAQLETELAHAELVRAQVVGELVADRARDLGAQLVRVVAEVA